MGGRTAYGCPGQTKARPKVNINNLNQKQMTSNKELLELQNNTETPKTENKPSQLIEKIRYEGTAFDIVGNTEDGYFVALGNFRITKTQEKNECRRMIDQKDYELILGLIGACIQADKNEAREAEITDKKARRAIEDAQNAY